MSKKEKRALTDEQIHALADDLRGTCDSLDEYLPEGVEFEHLSNTDCSQLDDIVMCCDNCGWWVESEFINDEGNCDECAEESKDE